MEPRLRGKAFVLRASMGLSLALASLTAPGNANAAVNQSENFLNSLYSYAHIHSSRAHETANHIFLAHPSLLQKWEWIGADGGAHYNGLTNTLVLKPEMTIHDGTMNRQRVRTLHELYDSMGASATVYAGVMFHEISHAEWDFFVEEQVTLDDLDLLNAMKKEVALIAEANNLSAIKAHFLQSEIFAYYREDLIALILNDATELLSGSGLQPITFACEPMRKRPVELRDLYNLKSPDTRSYESRNHLSLAWVMGRDVNLDIRPDASKRLNAALFKHTSKTMMFPKSRAQLFDLLREDASVVKALAKCQSKN